MKKTLYFDTETTGVDPKKCSIVQFAAIVEYEDEIVDRVDIKLQPFEDAIITDKALSKLRFTVDEMCDFMPHYEGFERVKSFMDKHINRFDKTDKFYAAGYNVRFDLDFLQEFFKFNGDKYGIGSYFNWKTVDPFPMMHILDWTGKLDLENYQLKTVCDKYKIPLDNEHDALADIEATRTLIKKLFK